MNQVGYFKLPKNGLAGIALALVMTIFSSSALAIDTSASIRGVVVDQSGNPVAGATVTAQSEGTSLTRSADANATGVFLIRNLPVGSTYTVTASEGGYSSDTFENIALVLGQTTALNFTLASAGVDYGMTVSCYRLSEAGEACGECDSCVLRAAGFTEAGVDDPTRYARR